MANKINQFASPPCFAHELEGNSDGVDTFDEECWRDVKRWRVSQRKTLLNLRKQLTANQRERETATVVNELDRLLISRKPNVMAVYWPIFSEMNLLQWMEEKAAAGLQLCLPVVSQKNQPLKFCHWKPGEAMDSGKWGIPIPSGNTSVAPDFVVVPLLGADAELHRLGYGGGYYDRTLVAFDKEVNTVGVGFSTARIPSIFPQPHDVALGGIILGK